MIPASYIIIRPPVEAFSVLIPITGGCSWNRCRFCNTYRNSFNNQNVLIQKYEIRELEQIYIDIDIWSKEVPQAQSVFLGGGNALSVPTAQLASILKRIKHNFHHVRRVSCYAKVLDILQKSEEELKTLQNLGLSICYIGIESGYNILLKYMHKGQTQKMEIRAIQKLMSCGIKASLYIILGLGGRKWSKMHAKETAKVINAVNPTIFRFRTLNVLPGSPLEQEIKMKKFEILTPREVLEEEFLLLSKIESKITSQFRNDHISNYTTTESENFGQDKEYILQELHFLIYSDEVSKWKHKNLKSM
ncbi:radical SAM protein [Candidatus Lokiarchaeum ossiferum]|uniref:radical SAM protein n=1 Tax=Candidatus Lokiarchaeum ossiferum TaxID=2951803 RepID=UPI00352F68D4